jgi:hypothetical protein
MMSIKKILQIINNYNIKWYHHIFVFFIAFIFIISRRVDILLDPQFWAEDGRIWYEQANNLGILKALITPHTGYFQTFSRLVASFAQFFPLKYGPIIFNSIAITFKILLINFLFSKRFSKVIPKTSTKIVLAFLYIALPNTEEVFANITNMHWYLAILAFMVIILDVSKKTYWKIFDAIVIILSGLSGPFVILLVPIAIVRWMIKKDKEFFILFLLLIACSLLQGVFILLTGFDTRSSMELGVSLFMFIKIVSGQIFFGVLIGKRGFNWLYNHDVLSNVLYMITFLIGSSVILFSVVRAQWELKLFLLFSALVSIISLAKPMASLSEEQWYIMSLPGAATRYWFIPILGFVMTILFLLQRNNHTYTKIVGICLFCIMSIGIFGDWFHHKWEDAGYSEYVATFETLSIGETIKIPIQPKGWDMTIIKK